jgi:hypothetical protein
MMVLCPWEHGSLLLQQISRPALKWNLLNAYQKLLWMQDEVSYRWHVLSQYMAKEKAVTLEVRWRKNQPLQDENVLVDTPIFSAENLTALAALGEEVLCSNRPKYTLFRAANMTLVLTLTLTLTLLLLLLSLQNNHHDYTYDDDCLYCTLLHKTNPRAPTPTRHRSGFERAAFSYRRRDRHHYRIGSWSGILGSSRNC